MPPGQALGLPLDLSQQRPSVDGRTAQARRDGENQTLIMLDEIYTPDSVDLVYIAIHVCLRLVW